MSQGIEMFIAGQLYGMLFVLIAAFVLAHFIPDCSVFKKRRREKETPAAVAKEKDDELKKLLDKIETYDGGH